MTEFTSAKSDAYLTDQLSELVMRFGQYPVRVLMASLFERILSNLLFGKGVR